MMMKKEYLSSWHHPRPGRCPRLPCYDDDVKAGRLTLTRTRVPEEARCEAGSIERQQSTLAPVMTKRRSV